MPWSSTLPYILWAVVFIPFSVTLLVMHNDSKLKYLTLILAYVAVNLLFFYVINWALIIYWLRYLPWVMVAIYLLRLFTTPRSRGWKPKTEGGRRLMIGALVVFALFAVLDGLVMRSLFYPTLPDRTVLVNYPLRFGMYAVVNGGNGIDGFAMNDHYRDEFGGKNADSDWLAYAIDMVEIRSNGRMADSFFDTNPNNYEGAYAEVVSAPCMGVVAAVEDSVKDVAPFSEPASRMGNYVVIQCANTDYYVTIANLRQGYSERPQVGEFVSFNRTLGYVGTSADPAIPFIHIHANVGGWDENAPPVVMKFPGATEQFKTLARNDILIP